MNTAIRDESPHKRLLLQPALWVAQVLLAGVYLIAFLVAISLPLSRVLTIVSLGWPSARRPRGVFDAMDLAAGLGVLLPSLTKVAPWLTALAAACSG